ncbi:hypothetical protein B0H19DRAFT_1241479 [Mycena capillaripes]|nr:hypothetical protein B0H19DRAFT_1241479 [Mycena capillaripes]
MYPNPSFSHRKILITPPPSRFREISCYRCRRKRHPKKKIDIFFLGDCGPSSRVIRESFWRGAFSMRDELPGTSVTPRWADSEERIAIALSRPKVLSWLPKENPDARAAGMPDDRCLFLVIQASAFHVHRLGLVVLFAASEGTSDYEPRT